MNRRRVGEDRGSKETDECPLTNCRSESSCVHFFWGLFDAEGPFGWPLGCLRLGSKVGTASVMVSLNAATASKVAQNSNGMRGNELVLPSWIVPSSESSFSFPLCVAFSLPGL
jgi:hypothetical protein